ncbi:MAG: Asp-tRNA(Asn)/Glu-tRNA(Gln) amidotransferase subunit GatC [Candidatus Obscuribacterales bacterium]|nr:Asp-tRNA(Asn)/Glu-tRNA(Gln) amidotransferase subunit GatC [Candidatus Obscuribacterales bacterium]
MSISIKDVEHVAKLARLALTEDEKKLYAEQLARIIDNFQELESVDTTGVEPLCHALPISNVLREDTLLDSLGRDKLMANAPAVENGFFRVPKIGE